MSKFSHLASKKRLLPIAVMLITCALILPQHARAVSQGDGTALYGEGTVTTPRYRQWTQATTSWGNESTGATAAATIRHTTIKAAPTRDELIAGVQTTGGVLYIQRWNGSSWSAEWNVTVGDGSLSRFDIAYERNSGEALVVYGANAGTTNELRYRRWDGSSWTGESNLDTVRTSGVIQGVQLAAHVGTLNDDIGLVWGDANLDLSASYWVGSSNTWAAEPAAALSTGLSVVGTATSLTTYSFDVALESSTGDMLVGWGSGATTDLVYVTRGVGSGGSWGSATTHTAALEEPTDLELASDPNSDYIAYANISDNGADADASTWTGSAWNTFSNFDTTAGTVAAGTKNISVSWLRSGTQDRAVVAYEDAATSAGIDWLFYNKNTNAWSALQTDFTTAPASATDIKSQRQITNPFNAAQLMLVAVDSTSDLVAKRLVFDGTNFTWSSSEPGGVALELTTSSITGFAADFAYARFATGALGVDIVDGSGVTVGSPSISMSSLDALVACQTPTGALGTASEKARVTNTTGNPAWTLTIAATSGNTATWSSGGTNYDFNDSSGTPAGCADGGDADSHAGQLSLSPSVATITPQGGCNTTGISLGSSAAFAQAVTDSITLATASGSAQTGCFWDFTGISVSQKVPQEKPAGTYTLNLTITITAN